MGLQGNGVPRKRAYLATLYARVCCGLREHLFRTTRARALAGWAQGSRGIGLHVTGSMRFPLHHSRHRASFSARLRFLARVAAPVAARRRRASAASGVLALIAARAFRRLTADCARPSGVLGPVDRPPWNRQRRLPGTGLHLQAVPRRVLALHVGLNRRMVRTPADHRNRALVRLGSGPASGPGSVPCRSASRSLGSEPHRQAVTSFRAPARPCR